MKFSEKALKVFSTGKGPNVGWRPQWNIHHGSKDYCRLDLKMLNAILRKSEMSVYQEDLKRENTDSIWTFQESTIIVVADVLAPRPSLGTVLTK